MDYGRLLARAWQITFRYRALWLFGFLLALFGGGGGGNGFNGNFGGGNGSGRTTPGGPFPTPNLPPDFFQNLTLIIVLVCCVILVLSIVGLVLRFISRAALIGLVSELETAGTTPTIGRGFGIGADRFWSQLGIAIVVNLPLTILSLVVIAVAFGPLIVSLMPALSRGNVDPDQVGRLIAGGGIATLGMMCCGALCLGIIYFVVQPFYEFILRANVIGRRGVMDSISEGYRLVRANLGNVAVLYILVIGIGIGFAILMLIVGGILLGVPAIVLAGIGLSSQNWTPVVIAGLCLGIPLFLVLIFIGGLFQVFESAVWTEGYLSITNPPAPTTPPAATLPAE